LKAKNQRKQEAMDLAQGPGAGGPQHGDSQLLTKIGQLPLSKMDSGRLPINSNPNRQKKKRKEFTHGQGSDPEALQMTRKPAGPDTDVDKMSGIQK